jgi:hypothetical protein
MNHVRAAKEQNMKARNVSMVKLLTVMAGIFAMAIGLTGLRWAGAQTEDESKAADTQKKTEKPAAGPDRPKQVEGKIIAQQRAQDYREKLDQPVTLEFERGTPLHEALNHIGMRYTLSIIVDEEAFKADSNQADIVNVPIKLPLLTNVRLRTVLRAILLQVDGDFYTRDDVLIIVPRARIASGVVLRQPVDVAFERRLLSDALKELSDMTGVSVILDAQKQQDPTLQVTADFRNVPLESAVRVLADMAGMKSITLENMIYVTAPDNADNMKKELTTTPPMTKTDKLGGM